MTPVERLLAKLPDARKWGDAWSARCPAHDDRRASLSVSAGADGRALVKCHAGCATEAVVEAVGLTVRDLMPDRPNRTPRTPRKGRGGARSFPNLDAAVGSLETRHGRRSAVWTYHDDAGEPVGAVARWDGPAGKDLRPLARHPDGWRVGAMPDPRPLYALPDLATATRVVVTEGEKAADAARSIGLIATTSVGGSQAAGKIDWRPLAGKEVWVFPDNDAPGRKYTADVATALAALTPAPVVRVVELPGLPEKGDLVDWIDGRSDAAEPDSLRAELAVIAETAEPSRPGATAPGWCAVRSILIGNDEYRVNDEATAALERTPDLYQRGGVLVRVLEHRPENTAICCIRRDYGEPVVRELTPANLREELSRCAEFLRAREDGTEPMHPPGWCVRAVHERGSWPGVRRLEAVVTHPVLRPDGSVLATDGFDPDCGLLVRIPPGLRVEVPELPTADDVSNAVALLGEVIADFPSRRRRTGPRGMPPC